MLPIISVFGFLSTKILSTFGTAGWVRFLSKRITNFVISGKITEIVEKVRRKITTWYSDYSKNIHITIALNVLIIGLTFFSSFFFTVNGVILFIISAISIFM